jgi:hypothetical protein
MLKKFDLFEKLNVVLGVASLSAIFVGALTTFGGLGLRHLSKSGVEIMPEERAERIANLGISSVTFGLLGYSSAIAIAVGSAIIPEVMKSAASQYQISKRKHLSQVPHTSDKLTVLKPIAFEVEESPIKSQANDKIYLYKVININGKSGYEGKLVVGRIEQEPNHKAIIYSELGEFQINFLCELFDEYNQNELVGKAFSSLQPNADNAVADYIDAHRHYISVLNKDDFSRCELEKCVGCINLYGDHKIFCGIHPFGWQESQPCPDKQVDSRLVFHKYECSEVIEHLNNQMKSSKVYIQRNDDGTLLIWDDHTNRKFCFDWSGDLLSDSDELIELGENASLLSYVEYFSTREVTQHEYSSQVDKLNEELKGIAVVKISDTGISVRASFSEYRIHNFRFRFDGMPLYPYESIIPAAIRNNYNLLTLVEYLKVYKLKLFKN